MAKRILKPVQVTHSQASINASNTQAAIEAERKEAKAGIEAVITGKDQEESGLAKTTVAFAHLMRLGAIALESVRTYCTPKSEGDKEAASTFFNDMLADFAPQFKAASEEKKHLLSQPIVNDEARTTIARIERRLAACRMAMQRTLRTAFFLIDEQAARDISLSSTGDIRVYHYRENATKEVRDTGYTASASSIAKLAQDKYKSGKRGTKSGTKKTAAPVNSANDGKTTHAQIATVTGAAEYLIRLTTHKSASALTDSDRAALQRLAVQLNALFKAPDVVQKAATTKAA